MYAIIMIIAVLLAGIFMLLKSQNGMSHPVLTRLSKLGIKLARADRLVCQKHTYVSKNSLMTAREQRFFKQLNLAVDSRYWHICPQVRVADIVKVTSSWRTGSREWWQVFSLISQWHCDVVIIDKRDFRIIAAIELNDSSHQKKTRQRRDILLEEVLRQAKIPLLCSSDSSVLVSNVKAHLLELLSQTESDKNELSIRDQGLIG